MTEGSAGIPGRQGRIRPGPSWHPDAGPESRPFTVQFARHALCGPSCPWQHHGNNPAEYDQNRRDKLSGHSRPGEQRRQCSKHEDRDTGVHDGPAPCVERRSTLSVLGKVVPHKSGKDEAISAEVHQHLGNEICNAAPRHTDLVVGDIPRSVRIGRFAIAAERFLYVRGEYPNSVFPPHSPHRVTAANRIARQVLHRQTEALYRAECPVDREVGRRPTIAVAKRPPTPLEMALRAVLANESLQCQHAGASSVSVGICAASRPRLRPCSGSAQSEEEKGRDHRP